MSHPKTQTTPQEIIANVVAKFLSSAERAYKELNIFAALKDEDQQVKKGSPSSPADEGRACCLDSELIYLT